MMVINSIFKHKMHLKQRIIYSNENKALALNKFIDMTLSTILILKLFIFYKNNLFCIPHFLYQITKQAFINPQRTSCFTLISYFNYQNTSFYTEQYLFKMKSRLEKEDQPFFDKQQSDIYEIITGKRKFNIQPFRQCDLQPHLIFKIKAPSSEQRYIPLQNLLTLSHFVNSPSQRLERAYARAIKQIMKEMELKHENTDPQNLKIRFQQSIQELNELEYQPNQQGIPGKTKKAQLIDEDDEKQEMEFNCLHKWTGTLDIFSLEINSIIYILQHECGFRIKAFIAYDKHSKGNNIYLVLSLPTENLLRVANKYRIKKEVDYSAFDFYLNDPCSEDGRPLRLNSKFKSDFENRKHQKQISRYFMLHQSTFKTDEQVEQQELSDEKLQNFRSCMEQAQLAFEYLKYKVTDNCDAKEKAYLFQYNRRKINSGCLKRYSIIKKRKEYFNILKEILPKYGYDVRQQPVVFKEFSLTDKEAKGATFYNKLENILLYKPLTVSSNGELSLFLNMEKTKLSYLVIKKYFKINYLSKIGMEIFTLNDQFQKFGVEGDSGGIDGQNLNKNWNTYSLFSNMKVVRNYLGQRVAYQALYFNYFIAYFASITIPFCILYTLQKIFQSQIWLYTSFIQSFAFSISFNIFMAYLKVSQQQFIKNYCEDVGSPMFLNKFTGPYQRNMLTDEPNQFIKQDGFGAVLKNLLCLILIVVFLVIFGAIFHGFRMLLVEIYQPLSQYRIDKVFSVAHMICYFSYFILEGLFRSVLLKKFIKILVKLKNPPTDEQKRQYFDNFTFFYLIGIQMIAPVFFLIIQPFQGTTCYANVCQYQLVYFVYSRYIYIILLALIKFFRLVFANYIKYKLRDIFKEESHNQVFYQEKLASLLQRIVQNDKKKQHVEGKMEEVINIHNYAIYCTLLPISPVIIFLTIFIDFINLRMGLLYNERRPVNRSQKIIRITKQLWYVYYLGIYMNSWTNIILLQFAQLNMQGLLQTFAMSLNYQAIFLIKFIIIIIYSLILQGVGQLFYSLGLSLSGSQLNKRKDNKYYDYLISKGGMKMVLKTAADLIPLKSLFRTFNPDKIPAEVLEDQLYKDIANKRNDQIISQVTQSAKDLLKDM